MPLSVTCPGCGKRLKAPDALAGRRLPCPNCKEPVQLPAAAEEDAAAYLLAGDADAPPSEQHEEPPPEAPEPAPPRRRRATPAEKLPPAGPDEPAPPRKPKLPVAQLPPLSAEGPPPWLRHLHWLLALALAPLAFSLLQPAEEDFEGRVVDALSRLPPERVQPLVQDIENGKLSRKDLLDALPDHRLPGAFLPSTTWAHWGFAVGAAVLFLAFLALLASYKAGQPGRLALTGLFTATAGVAFLLVVQAVAVGSQGVWLRGGGLVVLVVFYLVKLIGFSYQAALDPENGFLLSFLGYTLGVGFCEEVCKALPVLAYYREPGQQNWRTGFLLGLASGAGFGISEGVIYSSSFYNGVTGPGPYVVRFLSCVALHAVWTGSVSLTLHHRQGLIQAEVEHWYEYIPRLLLIVAVPMVLHGLYDTLLKKDLAAAALGVAVLSFAFLAFQISRLHESDDQEATDQMLREYKRRRLAGPG
jgi:RsiW-degrading membrane proteinase PrsW (M82 family)